MFALLFYFVAVSNNTALHFAAANGFSEGFYCLLQHGGGGASVSKSALEVARKHGKSNAIKKAGIQLLGYTIVHAVQYYLLFM